MKLKSLLFCTLLGSVFSSASAETVITKSVTEGGFKESFYPATIQNFTVGGKVCGLPNDVAPIILWYNKELCQKAGVDPTKIEYWEDFVDAVKKCQAAGITPIASGGNQLPGPDTGRVLNDMSADLASGNTTPEKAAKALEASWQQNKS